MGLVLSMLDRYQGQPNAVFCADEVRGGRLSNRSVVSHTRFPSRSVSHRLPVETSLYPLALLSLPSHSPLATLSLSSRNPLAVLSLSFGCCTGHPCCTARPPCAGLLWESSPPWD